MDQKYWINFKYKPYWLALLIFLIPGLVFLFTVFFLPDVDQYKIRLSIIETAVVSVVLFLFNSLLPEGRLKKLFFYLSYLSISFAVFIQVSYYYLYSDRISASTIFILIETNPSETIEFLGAYFNKLNLLLMGLLLIPLILVGKLFPLKKIELNHKAIFLAVLIALLFIYQYKSLANHNLYQITWASYHEYLEQTSLYDEYGLDEPLGNFQGVTSKKTNERKVFVVVIGESTTRHRMSLYGYPRRTSPKLEEMRDELVVFNDVISPHTHTIPSLSKIMSLKNYEDENELKKGSIIQLMNKAGFETTWVSNQKPVGFHENLVTKMANASSRLYFLNVRNYNVLSQYDEVILEPLNEVLQRDKDQFIIIHLLGTHAGYKNRYPDSFKYFKEEPPILNDPKGLEVVNHYDNAVRYNDFIISEIIDEVKKQNAVSYVLYFSDHGEDVYQVLKGASHTETNGTYPMYDVPFVLWQSKKFKENYNLEFREERPYMLDDLIYSISNLSGIEFEGIEPERSLFNESFKPRQRIIYDGKNYDSIFNK
jgi:heptose-I-phosphate ethanolaminephosphotransferase